MAKEKRGPEIFSGNPEHRPRAHLAQENPRYWRRENRIQRTRRNDFALSKSLSSALRYVALQDTLRTAGERYARIKAMSGEHEIKLMCETFAVSRSGYYDWLDAADSERAQQTRALQEESSANRYTRRFSGKLIG